jgi:hypothetical protein
MNTKANFQRHQRILNKRCYTEKVSYIKNQQGLFQQNLLEINTSATARLKRVVW